MHAPLPAKAQMVWSWLTHAWTRALQGELGCATMPGPAFGVVMKELGDARHAIGIAMTFIDTQQPFPYVHLLSIIVDVAMCVNAITVGVHTGRELGALPPPAAFGSAVLLCAIALLRVFVYTLVYYGLIGLGICLDNPLDTNPSVSSGADLPGLAFHHAMRTECNAFSKAVDKLHDKEWFTKGFEVKKKE